MKMPRPDRSLWDLITRGGHLADRVLWGEDRGVALGELVAGSSLDCSLDQLVGCAALVATAEQLTAALAMIALDGVAQRLVLCPIGVPAEHIPLIAEAADIDVLVSDAHLNADAIPNRACRVLCSPDIAPANPRPMPRYQTEWVLLTSGTTGLPKLVVHTLSSLTGAIKPDSVAPGIRPVWSTFYDIRRYGGLQIFLRAALGEGSLVLSSARETTDEFLLRAGGHGVTHISGTPSHWRRALMSRSAGRIAPQYVRLSGEIADQAILDDLRASYRRASVGHAFASTEAGVAFEVTDGLAGFSASLIERPAAAEVELRIRHGTLHIRSSRTATHYLSEASGPLLDADGFVDTGDTLELRNDRYYFVGRRDGVVNVGGLKVHPEEVEAVINRHPAVQMSLVKARKSPFTGAVVVADVVVRPHRISEIAGAAALALQSDIIRACRHELAPHKVPAIIRFVPSLNIGAAGKLGRSAA